MTARVQAVAEWLLTAIVLVNLAMLAATLLHKGFDADELQHTHIAWDLAQGKVLYRDFFEHHGPLYAYLDGAWFGSGALGPGVRAMFVLRVQSAAIAIGMLAATAAIAWELFASRLVALTAVALLSSLTFFADKVIEIRPDGLQNTLWLVGVYALLRTIARATSPRGALLSGLAVGAAVACNFKAALFPVIVLIALAAELRRRDRWALATAGWFVAGVAIVPLAFLAYFAAEHAAGDALFSNWTINELTYRLQTAAMTPSFARYWLTHQPTFVACVAGGAIVLVAMVRRPGELAPAMVRARRVFTVIALASALLVLGRFYQQIYLMFLPALAIVAAVGLQRVGQRVGQGVGPLIAIVLALAPLTIELVATTPWQRTALLNQQQRLTERILRETPRDEPIGMLWNACGGFMFNADVQYVWTSTFNIGEVFAHLTGADPFGEAYPRALDAAHVRYVIDSDPPGGTVPAATAAFLRRAFRYEGCVWYRAGN